MLTLYRRHRAKCKFESRNTKCSCPIWIQGEVHDRVRTAFDHEPLMHGVIVGQPVVGENDLRAIFADRWRERL